MRRIANEQSLLLRRRLTIQTVIALGAFTLAFAALALVANASLVPLISDAVVDATAEKVRFDPLDYVARHDVGELLESYRESVEKEGNGVEVLWIDPSIDDASDVSVFGRSIADNESLGNDGELSIVASVVGNQASGVGEDGSQASGVGEDGGQASGATVDEQKVAGDDDPEQQDEDPYDVVIGEVAIYPKGNQGEADLASHVEELTLRKLGYYAAWQAYLQLKGDWDYWYEGNGDVERYAPFVARNLTLYERIKSLKLPVAIALYMLGCLLIVIVQMRRSLRYFDELSNAVAGVITDRTKPVKLSPHLSVAQNELNRLRAESIADEYAAQAAEQRKNELVAYLAHDIRTPLTSILGYLSLLDESPDLPADSRQRFTHIALDKAERLESLIDEFFEITRYNLQSIPIERSSVDVRLFVEQIADEFIPVANGKEVGIEVDVEAPEAESFYVDGGKLARAVENVLRNAVSYADAGTAVKVQAAPLTTSEMESLHADGDASSVAWKISIINQGREISPEHLESIFEKFYREDNARNSTTGGAGLGLAIAKEIITAHGGRILAASKNGQTTFDIIV